MEIKCCRLCSSVRVTPIVDLGLHPLADTFLPESKLRDPEVSYPLRLGLCQSCGHVSTLFSVPPEIRYQRNEYSYDSANSPVSLAHFKQFAEAAVSEARDGNESLIVDVGSNVGTLLQHVKSLGFNRILGVEPSKNISRIAIDSGVPTINDFFAGKAASEITAMGKVQLLLSANVVNHADDLLGFLSTARSVLKEDGCFVFEVPYLLDLVNSTAFDTIYHEHVHYFGVKPLAECLYKQGFSIFKVEKIDYMCGSIRVFARLGGNHHSIVASMISHEEDCGLYELSTYDSFMQRVRQMKYSILSYLSRVKVNGGSIIGIGAATKGNTLLNYCRLDSDIISYITDSSCLKIGKYTPGSQIQIVADSDIGGDITHALILPWNIAPYLREKLSNLNLEFFVPQLDKINS